MSKLLNTFAAQTSYRTQNVRNVPVPRVQTVGPSSATIDVASTTYYTKTEREIQTSVKFTASVWVSEQAVNEQNADAIAYVKKQSL